MTDKDENGSPPTEAEPQGEMFGRAEMGPTQVNVTANFLMLQHAINALQELSKVNPDLATRIADQTDRAMDLNHARFRIGAICATMVSVAIVGVVGWVGSIHGAGGIAGLAFAFLAIAALWHVVLNRKFPNLRGIFKVWGNDSDKNGG